MKISNLNLDQRLHYTLRIAGAMCFIGHGAFGIITKPIWCNYFGVFGIGHDVSYQMMPIVGCIDICFGLLMLFYPLRIVPAWLVIWGFATAMLRPLSGEPFEEFIERAGNYGAPFALLLIAGGANNFKDLFTKIKPGKVLDDVTFKRLAYCLRVVAFMLLLGHGGLNIIEKKGLLAQYTSIGFGNPSLIAQIVGIAEIAAAFIVLLRPVRSLVLIFLIWKMGSELFYPHWEVFEWIERGGSYGILFALWQSMERKTFFEWRSGKLINSNASIA